MIEIARNYTRVHQWDHERYCHYHYIIMSAAASQITGVSIVCWTIDSGVDQRKYQSSALLAIVRGIHWWPVNSPHKRPVTRKMFPFWWRHHENCACSGFIMLTLEQSGNHHTDAILKRIRTCIHFLRPPTAKFMVCRYCIRRWFGAGYIILWNIQIYNATNMVCKCPLL